MSRHWLMIGLVGFGLSTIGEQVLAQGGNTGFPQQGNFNPNQFNALQQSLGNNGGLSSMGSGYGTSQLGGTGFGGSSTSTNANSGRLGTTSSSRYGTNASSTGLSTNQSMTSGQSQTSNNAMNNTSSFGANNQQGMSAQQQQLGNQQQGTTGRNATRNALGGGAQRSLFGQQFGAFSAFNALNGNQRQTGTIQPSVQLGFIPPTRAPEEVAEQVELRMQAVANRPSRLGIVRPELKSVSTVTSNDGIVTLSGKVPTASARRLAENMVRLEPGVRKIVNELQVEDAK